MSVEMNDQDGLGSALRLCAEALSRGESSDAPLRTLQHTARGFLFHCGDPTTRALAFMLDQWISDYYYNFAGDVLSPLWEQIERIRINLLKREIPVGLRTLADALESECTEIFPALVQVTLCYLDALDAANMLIKG